MVKNPSAKAGDARDVGSIPGSGRFPGGGHGNPLQYSCLKIPMDRGAWRATGHRVEKVHTHTHIGPPSIPFSTHFYKTIRQNPCNFHKHILLTRYERELPKLTSWLTGETTMPKLEMFGLRV